MPWGAVVGGSVEGGEAEVGVTAGLAEATFLFSCSRPFRGSANTFFWLCVRHQLGSWCARQVVPSCGLGPGEGGQSQHGDGLADMAPGCLGLAGAGEGESRLLPASRTPVCLPGGTRLQPCVYAQPGVPRKCCGHHHTLALGTRGPEVTNSCDVEASGLFPKGHTQGHCSPLLSFPLGSWGWHISASIRP